MRSPTRELLAKNLKTLMASRIELATQKALAAKAGVSQRTISNMLRPEATDLRSPKLDSVESVAHAFGLAAWQVLIDPKTLGGELASMVMRPSVPDDDKRLTGWDASKASRHPSPRTLTRK